MEQDIVFDFESQLGEGPQPGDDRVLSADMVPTGEFGQQPGNYRRNFKKTVCRYWIKGMCMRGDQCGFLHEMIPERMPDCPDFKDKGVCNDPDCPFKHDIGSVLECNMYALGFCIYGPQCRYKHTRKPGPPPDPSEVEAAKPKMFRDINRVVNSVNKDVVAEANGNKRQRIMDKARAAPVQPTISVPQRPRPPSGPPPGALMAGFVGTTHRPVARFGASGRFGGRGGFAGRMPQPRPPQPRPPQEAPPPSSVGASTAVDTAGYGF